MRYCPACFEKQQKIDALQEQIVSLKAKLRLQERTAREGFFGSSTPSSQIPIKPDRYPSRTSTEVRWRACGTSGARAPLNREGRS